MEGDDGDKFRLQIQRQISIHTLRVEGDAQLLIHIGGFLEISIHTLRVEGDQGFNGVNNNIAISIHTLRVEGDSKSAQKSRTLLFKSNRPAEKLPTGRA